MWTGLRRCFDLGLRKCGLMDFVMELPGFLNDVLVKLTFDEFSGTRMAFLTALGELAPWALMQIPLMP